MQASIQTRDKMQTVDYRVNFLRIYRIISFIEC